MISPKPMEDEMTKRISVRLVVSADTFAELIRQIRDDGELYFSSSHEGPMAHVLLDFPTAWSLSQLEEMNSVDRARTVVVTQGRQSAYSDVIASYHVSGVVPVSNHAALLSSIYAAAASMRTYVWQSGLTYMELRVARLLLRGCDTAQAASALKVSTKTINAHISNAIGKLGLESRAQFISALLAQHKA